MSRFRNREAPLEKERFLKLLSRVGVLCHLHFSVCSSIYHPYMTFLQNFPGLPSPSFWTLFHFILGSLFKLQGYREHQWEYHDCHCPQGEFLRASKDTGVPWLADSLSITVTKPNRLGARRYLTPTTDLHRYKLNVLDANSTCWSAYSTLVQALKLSASFYLACTHTSIC